MNIHTDTYRQIDRHTDNPFIFHYGYEQRNEIAERVPDQDTSLSPTDIHVHESRHINRYTRSYIYRYIGF